MFGKQSISAEHIRALPTEAFFFLINKLCKLSLLPELAMSPLIMQLTTMDLEIQESMS